MDEEEIKIKSEIQQIFEITDRRLHINKDNDHTYNIIINDRSRKKCVDMTIYTNTREIHINHIDRCGLFRGNQIITNVINFSKKMDIHKISLQDKSRITIGRCNFPLSYYLIT